MSCDLHPATRRAGTIESTARAAALSTQPSSPAGGADDSTNGHSTDRRKGWRVLLSLDGRYSERDTVRHRSCHMTDEILPPAGGYAAAPGWLQYSRGVRALADHTIVRVRFQTPIPLDAGFVRIATWLRDRGRPLTSLCACELRSPKQFTEDGF